MAAAPELAPVECFADCSPAQALAAQSVNPWVALASVNIFGGFAVTERMLAMYKKKERS